MAEVGLEINITGGEEFSEMRVQDAVDFESPRIMERVTVNLQRAGSALWSVEG